MKFLGNIIGRKKLQIEEEDKTWSRELHASSHIIPSSTPVPDFNQQRNNKGGPMLREVAEDEDFTAKILGQRKQNAPQRVQPIQTNPSAFVLPSFPSSAPTPPPETAYQSLNPPTPQPPNPSAYSSYQANPSTPQPFSNSSAADYAIPETTPRNQEESAASRYEELQNQLRQRQIREAQTRVSRAVPANQFSIFTGDRQPKSPLTARSATPTRPTPTMAPVPVFGEAKPGETVVARRGGGRMFVAEGEKSTTPGPRPAQVDPYRNMDSEQLFEILQRKRIELRGLEDSWERLLRDPNNFKAVEYRLEEVKRKAAELPEPGVVDRDLRWLTDELSKLDQEITRLSRGQQALTDNPSKVSKVRKIAQLKNKAAEFRARLSDEALLSEQIRAKSDQGMRERQEMEANEIAFDDTLQKAMEGLVKDRLRGY